MLDLQKVKEQFELVKDFETFVITTQTVKELIEKIETLNNEYEIIRKQRTWYKNRYEKLQLAIDEEAIDASYWAKRAGEAERKLREINKESSE